MNLKSGIRSLAHTVGAYRALHRGWHRDTLTVLGFHRVLPVEDDRHATAMPEFTISPEVLEEVLRFSKRHYALVPMDLVCAAAEGQSRLPPFAATVTFDDGWSDNHEFAAPILERLGIPATLFLCGGILDGADAFWREDIYAAAQVLDGAKITNAWMESVGVSYRGVSRVPLEWSRLIEQAGKLDRAQRQRLMDALRSAMGRSASSPLMTTAEARSWSERFSLGAHGYNHDPMTRLEDPGLELQSSLRARAVTDVRSAAWTSTMSFPHGQYDQTVSDAARTAGFRLLFTSDRCLNRLDQGRPVSDVLGRVWASTANCTRDGRFSAADAANHFFRAPVAVLDGDRPRYL